MNSPETRTDNPPPAMSRAELERRIKAFIESPPEEMRSRIFDLQIDDDSEAASLHNIFIGELICSDEDPRALIERYYGAR